MKLGGKEKFEPCPEFTGRGVCVDFTPPKRVVTQYGEKDVCRIVFELDLCREDGSRWCCWSQGFTVDKDRLVFGEKSNLRKFLRGWMGRELTADEVAGFDTESLIGWPAFLVVTQTRKGDEVYANIASCTRHQNGDPLKASGSYKRVKDREGAGANGGNGGVGGASGSGYRRTETPGGVPTESGDVFAIKVHVGKFKGVDFTSLAPEAVEALEKNWLPGAKAQPKLSADDGRLVAAIEGWRAQQSAPGGPDDNLPF